MGAYAFVEMQLKINEQMINILTCICAYTNHCLLPGQNMLETSTVKIYQFHVNYGPKFLLFDKTVSFALNIFHRHPTYL